jgi:tetratricopeptide (TPR) repeat protein
MHEVDHRSDIYSLGITLYELLTLHPAFDAATRQELLRAVECDSPVSPRRLNPSIPADLETIVLKAIEKNRDDRYMSAGELAEDLGHFLGGRPTLAKRPRLQDQAFRWAIRHRTAVTAGVAAVMLTLLLVSASAVMIHVEKRRTQVEAKRAALHLRETQRVVDNFGALVDQRLEHLPGSSSLRAELLGELEKYYSAFLIQAGDDPSFAIDLATTQFRLAAVHQRLGDLQQAADGYRKSLAGFQQLASQAPGDLDRMADIALCRNNLGQVASKLGDHDQAREDYEAAITIYSRLADAGDAKGHSGLARTQMNLAMLLPARSPDASRLLAEALESLQILSSESPDDLDVLDQFALCENNLASVVLATDPERAESLLRCAKQRYERLTSARPGSPEHRSDQALTLGNLAAVVAHQGDYELASSLYRDVVRVRKILIDIEPGVISHSYDLAIAQQQLGGILASANRLQGASGAYEDARQTLTRLVEINPRDHRTRSNLGSMLSNLGTLENRLGNSDRGLELFQQAEQQQQQAVELSPENHQYQELLNQHQEQISQMKLQVQEPLGEKSVKAAGT